MLYVIYREDKNMYVRWNQQTLLFDSPEQAQGFIDKIKIFFESDSSVPMIIPASEDIAFDLEASLRFSTLSEEQLDEELELLTEKYSRREMMKNG